MEDYMKEPTILWIKKILFSQKKKEKKRNVKNVEKLFLKELCYVKSAIIYYLVKMTAPQKNSLKKK